MAEKKKAEPKEKPAEEKPAEEKQPSFNVDYTVVKQKFGKTVKWSMKASNGSVQNGTGFSTLTRAIAELFKG